MLLRLFKSLCGLVCIWDVQSSVAVFSPVPPGASPAAWLNTTCTASPDYMDLSEAFINSAAAARVCITLQMKNAAHKQPGRYRFVKTGGWKVRKGARRRETSVIILLTDWHKPRSYQYEHFAPGQLHTVTFCLLEKPHADNKWRLVSSTSIC